MHFLFTTRCTLSKRSKTHKRLKERFLTGRNRSKRANVRGSPLFQATFNTKTEKQTINSTYLASEGKGMFVFLFLCCAWLEKEDFLENLHVLSCFVQLKSVLLISCVFWIFFLNAGSQLCLRSLSKYFIPTIGVYIKMAYVWICVTLQLWDVGDNKTNRQARRRKTGQKASFFFCSFFLFFFLICRLDNS